jgi:hypothetical protein
MRMTGTALLGLVLAFALISRAAERDYRFDGRISREVLDNYLSRAATFADFLHGKGSVADNLRFLTNTGAKFVETPGSRLLHTPVGNQWWYWANTRSAAAPEGLDQEETIKAIWAQDVAEGDNGSPGTTGPAASEAGLFERSLVSRGDPARLQHAASQ